MAFTLPVADEGASPKVTTRAFLEDAVNGALNGIAVGAMTGFPSYTNTTLGLAATSDGEGFSVIGEVLSLYLNNAGVAELQGEISLAGVSSSVIYAEDYGVHGNDFVDYTSNANLGADKSTALYNALVAANAAKAMLVLPAGKINLESLVDLSVNSNLHVNMVGQGESTRLLVDGSVNTDGALKFECTTNNVHIMDVTLKDFVITPLDSRHVYDSGTPASSTFTQTACGQAIQIIHRASRKRALPEANLYNVHVESIDLGEAYFNKQLVLKNLWIPSISSCRFNQLLNSEIGSTPGASSRFRDTWVAYAPHSALHSLGNYALHVSDCIFRCGGGDFDGDLNGAPIYIDTTGNAEGGSFINCVSNFGKTGVVVTGSTQEPGFQYYFSHVNARDYCFKIDWARKTAIEQNLLYMDDSTSKLGTNPDSALNPALIQYGTSSGSDHSIKNNRWDYADLTNVSNFRYIESLANIGKVYHVHENKSNALFTTFGRGFDAINQQTVYAADNEFQNATISWDNGGAPDYQYEEIQNSRRVIYGVGDPSGATMPGTLETTTIFIDTSDTLNRPPYRWISGTSWTRDIGAANGSVTGPGFSFANNIDALGFFRPAEDIIGVTSNDLEVARFGPSGVSLDEGANWFSEYARGTWVVEVADASAGGNTGSFGTGIGTYVRLGDLVTFQLSLVNIVTTGMTAGNALYIRGFPFTFLSQAQASGPLSAHCNSVATTTREPFFRPTPGTSYGTLVEQNTSITTIVSQITSGVSDIYITGSVVVD